jgi:hypothetical protein
MEAVHFVQDLATGAELALVSTHRLIAATSALSSAAETSSLLSAS